MTEQNSIPSNSDWITTLTAEMLLFGLLGKLFYEYPEKDWLHSLVEEDVFAEIPFAQNQPEVQRGQELLQEWSRREKKDPKGTAFEAVRADYTRLFIGIDAIPAPLWESVHFNDERMVFQEQTMQVRAWYRKFGLQVENYQHEPDDHVGLEMAFISHLAKLGLEALEANNQEALIGSLDAQRGFLSEHMLKWIPGWCDQVEKKASTDFFRGMACVIRGALAELTIIFVISFPVEQAR
jgi:TorA maturation chaperone TorD